MFLNECVVTKEKFYILKGKILCNCSKIDGYLKVTEFLLCSFNVGILIKNHAYIM